MTNNSKPQDKGIVKQISELQDILWTELLRIAALKGYDQGPRSLHAALTEMRGFGTQVQRLDSGKFVLRPVIGKGCWLSQESYDAWKSHHLKPHHERLIECLASLYCGKLADVEQVAKITVAMEDPERGWVRLKSAVLDGEVIIIARDSRAAERVGVGGHGAVIYTLRELKNLVDCPPTPEFLRELHQVKKIFPGSEICEAVEEGAGGVAG
ncbi:MAG: hypothetical protein DDT19_01090 [Syntrophomonadaceae bacterium]|nr:hypothetical protein [Bacillota bacterium]